MNGAFPKAMPQWSPGGWPRRERPNFAFGHRRNHEPIDRRDPPVTMTVLTHPGKDALRPKTAERTSGGMLQRRPLNAMTSPNVIVIDHPVVQTKLTELRDYTTDHRKFRTLLDEI